jgi:hypothetical protein
VGSLAARHVTRWSPRRGLISQDPYAFLLADMIDFAPVDVTPGPTNAVLTMRFDDYSTMSAFSRELDEDVALLRRGGGSVPRGEVREKAPVPNYWLLSTSASTRPIAFPS